MTILITGALIPRIRMEHYPTVSISWSWLPLQVTCAREDVRRSELVARETRSAIRREQDDPEQDDDADTIGLTGAVGFEFKARGQ